MVDEKASKGWCTWPGGGWVLSWWKSKLWAGGFWFRGFEKTVGVGTFRFRVLGFRWNCGLDDVVRVRGR